MVFCNKNIIHKERSAGKKQKILPAHIYQMILKKSDNSILEVIRDLEKERENVKLAAVFHMAFPESKENVKFNVNIHNREKPVIKEKPSNTLRPEKNIGKSSQKRGKGRGAI